MGDKGPGSKGGDFVHPLVKHAPQNLAFLPTHGGKPKRLG